MSLKKAFGTSKKAEQDGVEIELTENSDGTMATMRIRRAGETNKKFQSAFAKKQKQLAKARGDKTERSAKAMREVFVDTCLVSWENIEDIRPRTEPSPTDEPRYMELTRENAILLFEQIPDLFNYVLEQSMDLTTFQIMEENAGN